MSPGHAAPRGALEPHATDGIWYASYPPGVGREIDPSRYRSLAHFFDECVERFRDRVAFVSLGSELSFAALGEKAHAFASYLQGLGVKPGDRVALMMPNTLPYPVTLFGALMAGAIVVNVNPLYTVRELGHQLKDSGAHTIVVFENFAKTVQDAQPGSRIRNVIVTGLGDLLGSGLNVKGRALDLFLRHVKKQVPAYSLPDAIRLPQALARGARRTFEPVRVGHGDIAFIQYTGGTTGTAKGAMLTHRNVIANLLQALAWARSALVDEKETVVTPLPLYHIYSLTVNALAFLGIGARNVLIVNPRDIDALMRALRHENFTAITALNTLYSALLDNDEFRRRDFSALKLAMAGGMATQRAVAERFRALTGQTLIEGYGLTECSPLVCATPLDAHGAHAFDGTIGLPVPSTLVRLRRDDGSWANIGEPGELCVQGPQVMKGYWNRPEDTTQAVDANGWLATGDIGVMDARGFIRLIDRKKDMMIVSGFNVYPNEIEDVLAAHPKVRAVAVVGVPDPVTGERVKAFVVKRDDTLSMEELLRFARLHLTGYKVPASVEFRDSLPQTTIGKVLRRELRDAEPKSQD
ncbi:AMP-binding protein [Caballeronia ptereochthonis]|uniref:Long-chain-fatty-acid--CoA ligase n=1 Tax=Caballeronia ptereochthonis TaxID=1777144 RepID=A0A158CYX2_9BURK|nr:AMP-binding protein [Caballeronia ptereochthonis]SAK87290.1 AMP-dependent synthetase and ligase [Caballeronia ptereochthonis]